MTLASGLVTTLGLPRRRGSLGGGIIVIGMETVICSLSLEPKRARNRMFQNTYSKHETNRLTTGHDIPLS